MSTITINGNTYAGNSVTVNGNNIIIDGVKQFSGGNNTTINVEIIGNTGKIDCNGSVTVNGTVNGDIDCGGSCSVDGDVKGSIDCGGSCNARNVGGDIDAGGSVKYVK